MTADQINELRDEFRRAMLDWDVPVGVTIDDDTANVSFELWGVKIEGGFYLDSGKWNDGGDCPHVISDKLTAWQWIAMQLHEKLTA